MFVSKLSVLESTFASTNKVILNMFLNELFILAQLLLRDFNS